METLDRFASTYLGQWERLATVRATRRYVLAGEVTGDGLYPPDLQPLLHHPDVAALGPDSRRFILVQSCYRFMNEIALLETDVVGRLAGDVSNRPHRIELSPPVRQVALTVAVDEVYHAFTAREFIAQVAGATGMPPLDEPRECQLGAAIAAARARTPEPLHDDLALIALCIAENSITREILLMTQEANVGTPFYAVSAEHLSDEGRHAGYFQHLLRHYWARLDEDTRCAMAGALPVFLERFLVDVTRFAAQDRAMLRGAGLAGAVADRVVAETYGRPFARRDHPMAGNVMRLLERSGVLEHAPTHEVLRQHEWLPA